MIQTPEDFCQWLQPDASIRSVQKSLYWLLSLRSARKKRQEYQIFWLAKHSGGYRPVAAPSLGLKKVQRGILSLLSVGEVSPHATAYQPGCTLLRNAAPHVGQPFVVKLDIANFFGSIPFPAVYAAIDRALCRNPEIQSSTKASSAREGATESYNAALSFFFATLCTLDGVLPQGAPTSPLLSNLVFFPLDCRIAAFCEGRKIHYTRYSDDLTFSGDFSPDTLIRFIRRLLCEHGFLLHESKTVIARRGNRQQVTGILVNDRPQAGRKFRRRIRQELYYIQRFGLSSHLLHEGRTGESCAPGPYLHSLLGRIQFVLQVCPYDREFLGYRAYVLQKMKHYT